MDTTPASSSSAAAGPPRRGNERRPGSSSTPAPPHQSAGSPDRLSPRDNVAALVYVAAFGPDRGESVNTLIAGFPADGPQPPILPPDGGFLLLDRDKFHGSFAGDVPAGDAAFLADSQVPWGLEALGGTVTNPAWRGRPSWYLVAADDRMIPPSAHRAMADRMGAAVVETPGSHAVYVSRPDTVADVIRRAAAGQP